ncbi:envelope stress response membrane protein PspB [Thaumasiovibrio sp. DFM-14]|uniref:envelope stress response membrane protein PspB n=1 Tax=Thaumasiovibrio sp. DFM-14 TaxID=3384792 RepID=UPI0039A14801
MSMGFLAGPLIVFLVLVAPLWLILHYRSKRNTEQGLSTEDYARLQALSEQADKMHSRIQSLEKILDVESPGWRQR